jgi:integrase
MKIALTKKVQREDGERVYVAPETEGDGIFYLSWYEGTKRRRESIPATTLKQAQKAQANKQADMDADERKKANGTYVAPEKPADRVLLKDAAAEYLADIKAHKAAKTYNAYSKAVEYFLASCKKTFLDSVDRKDMLAYKTYLVDEAEQAPRSVWNKFAAVMSFLRTSGRGGKVIGVVKGDWPEYDTDAAVDIYKDAELKKFYAACDEAQERWFKFFEFTGMREGEVQHCQWSWISLEDRTVTVQPDGKGWRPKKNKVRGIPMSTPLFELLTEWRKATKDSTCDLVFPTSGCDVKLDFLDCLKRIAKDAGLFCGKCKGCVEANGKPKAAPNCEKWYLHKFRSTFGTRVLRKTDVRTAMEWMGHTDMESTMRYLRPAEGKDAQSKMDAVFA